MTYDKISPAARASAATLTLVLLLCACGEQRFLAPDAPGFTLPAMEGAGEISLGDYRGDVVYLTFWASWCVPCREEMPVLSGFWQQHRDEGFTVIGINVDEDMAAARAFAAEYAIEFPLARDEGRSVSKLYHVAGYPSHFVIDRRGKVRYSALGFTEADTVAVTREVAVLLAEQAGAED